MPRRKPNPKIANIGPRFFPQYFTAARDRVQARRRTTGTSTSVPGPHKPLCAHRGCVRQEVDHGRLLSLEPDPDPQGRVSAKCVFPRDKRVAFAWRPCSIKKLERDDDSNLVSSRSSARLPAAAQIFRPDVAFTAGVGRGHAKAPLIVNGEICRPARALQSRRTAWIGKPAAHLVDRGL